MQRSNSRDPAGGYEVLANAPHPGPVGSRLRCFLRVSAAPPAVSTPGPRSSPVTPVCGSGGSGVLADEVRRPLGDPDPPATTRGPYECPFRDPTAASPAAGARSQAMRPSQRERSVRNEPDDTRGTPLPTHIGRERERLRRIFVPMGVDDERRGLALAPCRGPRPRPRISMPRRSLVTERVQGHLWRWPRHRFQAASREREMNPHLTGRSHREARSAWEVGLFGPSFCCCQIVITCHDDNA